MKRRLFLQGAAIATIAGASFKSSDGVAKPNGIRISIDQRDPGFAAFVAARKRGQKVIIRLNGKEVQKVVLADERVGMLRKYQQTTEGKLVHDGEKILTEDLYGNVEVELRAE